MEIHNIKFMIKLPRPRKYTKENKWISLCFKLNNFKYWPHGILHYKILLSKYMDPSWSDTKGILNWNALEYITVQSFKTWVVLVCMCFCLIGSWIRTIGLNQFLNLFQTLLISSILVKWFILFPIYAPAGGNIYPAILLLT